MLIHWSRLYGSLVIWRSSRPDDVPLSWPDDVVICQLICLAAAAAAAAAVVSSMWTLLNAHLHQPGCTPYLESRSCCCCSRSRRSGIITTIADVVWSLASSSLKRDRDHRYRYNDIQVSISMVETDLHLLSRMKVERRLHVNDRYPYVSVLSHFSIVHWPRMRSSIKLGSLGSLVRLRSFTSQNKNMAAGSGCTWNCVVSRVSLTIACGLDHCDPSWKLNWSSSPRRRPTFVPRPSDDVAN